jgi:hypothetical protein
MRATTRACAAAATVQRPLRTGTTFASAQRFSVVGETPEIRAASAIEISLSGIVPDL